MNNISLIVAVSKNKVIGKNNSLPWHIPKDLARFKALTKGAVVIMGRNTYESLPEGKLPGRYKIVLSTQISSDSESFFLEDTIFVKGREEALAEAAKLSKRIFICGGPAVYSEFLDDCSQAYITYINKEFDGDTYFPEFSICQWQKKDSEEFYNYDISNHMNNFEYKMERWEKVQNTVSCS